MVPGAHMIAEGGGVATSPSSAFSWRVMLALVAVLLLSTGMFLLLAWRWTSHRRRVALGEWARGKGFRFATRGECPNALASLDARVTICLSGAGESGADVRLLELATETTPASKAPERPARWHLLVRPVGGNWPATALRPASNRTSTIDGLGLSSYPSLLPPERFVVFGTDAAAAVGVADSHLPGLLPADVGLVLEGGAMVLDFSARPFDELEFDRMIALAEQLAANTPAAPVVVGGREGAVDAPGKPGG